MKNYSLRNQDQNNKYKRFYFMRKTRKKIIGLFGLVLVIAVTIFAALLPSADTSAKKNETNSSVDIVTVRVTGPTPTAEITDPISGEAFVSPDQTIQVSYESVKDLVITVEYTAPDGTKHSKILWSGEVDEQTGSMDFDFRTISEDFGYGDYVITVNGTGNDDMPLPGDSVTFSYYPLSGSIDSNSETGEVFLDLTYQPHEEGSSSQIEKFKVNVYDQDGNLVTQFSPIIINAPDTRVEIPFLEYGMPQGLYRVEVIALDASGNDLYAPFYLNADFRYASPDAPNSPDTGGLFGSLNISRTDFLITGAIVFLIVAVCAFVFILKRSKSSKEKH